MTTVAIRRERADDAAAIQAVHCAAFPTEEEARLVNRLRAAGRASVSLVAQIDDGDNRERNSTVVGHILFSPVVVVGPSSDCSGLGLAPMAVLPAYQRGGIGSALIRAGASVLGLQNEYGADEAFMVQELRPGALPTEGGLVKYGPEFAVWGS